VTGLRFTKMHGAGNDFVILDRLLGAAWPDTALARRLADRHFGVGCDQIMLIERAVNVGSAFAYQILNADGSSAGQCGNGARCVARYLRDRHNLADGAMLDSPGGVIVVRFLAEDQVELALGVPRLQPSEVPFLAASRSTRYALDVAGQRVQISALSMGNPHAVCMVERVSDAPVASLGPMIETHPQFPDRANVGFVEIVDRAHVRLRVWERGVGETLACGSGASAAVVAMQLLGAVDQNVVVDLPGGRLRVRWQGEGCTVYLAGPAEFVFDGEFYL